MDEKLIFKDLTSQIIGAAMEVHKTLGPGFLENIYEVALFVELSKHQKLKVQTQITHSVDYKGDIIGSHIMDMIVEDKVIVELKSVENILSVHEAQIISYLYASKLPVGLLINFGAKSLVFRRFINSLENPRNPRNPQQNSYTQSPWTE